MDGTSVGSSATAPLVVPFDTTALLDGPLVVTAISRDLAGNTTVCSSTLKVNNLSVRVFPRVLRGRARCPGRLVAVWVEGASADLLYPLAGRQIELHIPGGNPVPVEFAFPGSGPGDLNWNGVPDLFLKFKRRDVLSSIQAGISAGAIQPNSRFRVKLVVDGRVIGKDRMFIVGGGTH